MGINYRVKVHCRPSNKELLTSGKGDCREAMSEGSQTVKSCTEEHESHTEAGLVGLGSTSYRSPKYCD